VGAEDPNAKPSQEPSPPEPPTNVAQQSAIAMNLPVVLVGAVVLGGALGYGLDHLLHTWPVFMIVFGCLGLFGGIMEIYKWLVKGSRGSSGKQG
jgi:ATP synthase protein I